MNFSEIDSKWNSIWENKKCFENDPLQNKEKKFITAAFPYPNSPQHIGHGRTYTTTDIYARYLRLKGYNVLFPMGFHVTGTPIIAMAQRIAQRDEDVLKVFSEIYGIPREKALTLTDPRELVLYFSNEIEKGMKEMGYSIDWRRKFYSFDDNFNKFIQWQFRKLKNAGYLVKGEYPIAWCPNDQQAVSAHDTKGDVDPELEKVTAIKFKLKQRDAYIVVTTYRPETIYGVTNIWINPKIPYVIARLKNENYILAKEAAHLLSYQLNLEIIDKITPEELLSSTAINPINKDEIPIYPASFVKEDVGSGAVMSVPAHAPYDYLALRDLGKDNIKMPQVIQTSGYGANPSKEIVEKLGVKDQNDEKAEEATKELYKVEAHNGKMVVGDYKGIAVKEAKEKIADDLLKSNNALTIYTIANTPVYCRCGSKVVVNILQNQWFIDYGNQEWKEKTKECLRNMRLLPPESRAQLEATVEWLKTKPCSRAKGLGTKFPFDESKMIEALSDSTIYMAFYTISHLLKDIPKEEINDELFDYVFLGIGEGKPSWKKLRESFTYWYPLDSRHSGADLLRNHLALFVFNHVAIFPKEFWPKQIVTNGFVLMDGAKMSKSMGNILPLRKALKEYGADVIRLAVVCGADLLHDTDFNKTVAEGIRVRLNYINELIKKSAERKEINRMDKWLLSKLNKKIKKAEKLYEDLDLRGVSMELFYDVYNDLKWYCARTENYNLNQFFEKWVVAISPFIPHVAEEWWSMLEKNDLVINQSFPQVDENAIDDDLEKSEEFVKQTLDDVEKVISLVKTKGIEPKNITLYVADEWKHHLYSIAREQKSMDKIMIEAKNDPLLASRMDEVAKVTKQIIKNIHSLPSTIGEEKEYTALKDSVSFFEKETGCKVVVLMERDAKHEKAKNALPGKAAILVE
ncbi:MAG: leucine--tRNA ligase [Candidatus Bilamarchaeaceae archaeon]